MSKERSIIWWYLDEICLVQTPWKQWWILLHSFNSILIPLDVCFKLLQGKATTIVVQTDGMKIYSFKLQCLFSVKKISGIGAHLVPSVAIIDSPLLTRGRRCIEQSKALNFIKRLLSSLYEQFNHLDDITHDKTFETVCHMVLHLCNQIDNQIAVWNKLNAPMGS